MKAFRNILFILLVPILFLTTGAVVQTWKHSAVPTKLIFCLSADTKPTVGIPAGSELIETDTSTPYVYTGSSWIEAMRPAYFLKTVRKGWTSVGTITKAAVDADGGETALGVTERSLVTTSILDTTVVWTVPYGINAAEVRFLLLTNDADVDIDMWAVRKDDDALVRICTLDIIAGQQTHSNGTHVFAQQANVSNNNWLQTVGEIVSGADDYVARVIFDLGGYSKIIFHGYGTFDEDCVIEVSGY